MVFRSRVLEKFKDGRYRFEAVPTCLCGESQQIPLASQDRFGIPVEIVGCPRCGLIRTAKRLAADQLADFYQDDYHGLHMGVDKPNPRTVLFRRGQGEAVFRSVRPYLQRGEITVAEVGAGAGSVLREFAAAAAAAGSRCQLVGCEYSPAFVEVGRSLGLDLRLGGIERLADIGQPDVVILSHVLEHLPDPPADLSRIDSLLRPTSVLYVEVPGILSIHEKPEYDYTWQAYLTLAHTYHFTLRTLTDLMRRSGFHMLDGDERVRAVFRTTEEPEVEAPDAHAILPAEMAYLAWLESAPRLRAKRLITRGRRRLRRVIRSRIGPRR